MIRNVFGEELENEKDIYDAGCGKWFAGFVYADIAIELKNNGGVVYVAGTSGTVTVDEGLCSVDLDL